MERRNQGKWSVKFTGVVLLSVFRLRLFDALLRVLRALRGEILLVWSEPLKLDTMELKLLSASEPT